MKEQYIKQVMQELSISHKKKKEIARDLNEVFSSALEHGETEKQVIERLGSPKEFAENVEEQFGFNKKAHLKKRNLTIIIMSFAISIISFVTSFIVQVFQTPKNVIGQANAMTSINIEAPFSFDMKIILVIIGIVFSAYAIYQLTKYIHQK